jgi:hypothetical protein
MIKNPMDLSLVETKLKTLKVGQIHNTVKAKLQEEIHECGACPFS